MEWTTLHGAVVGALVGAIAAGGSLALTRRRAELAARGQVGRATLLYWLSLASIAGALLALRPLGAASLWAGAASLLGLRAALLIALRRRVAAEVGR